MVIWYSSRFEKSFKGLPKRIQTAAIKKEKLFRSDRSYQGLFDHELSGHLSGFRSFRISYAYRILYRLNDDGSVLFIDVGTHSIYR